MGTLLTVVVSVVATSAVESARTALAELDFAKADGLCVSALKQGGLVEVEVRELWAIRGQALAAQGFSTDAQVAFERALSLSPTFEISPDASPKLTKPFRLARQRVAGRRLSATLKTERVTAETVLGTVVIQDDVTGLVAKVVSNVNGDAASSFDRQADQFSGSVSCVEACLVTAIVMDDSGNTLLVLRSRVFAPPKTEANVVQGPSAQEKTLTGAVKPDRPWYRHPAFWFSAAGVAVAVASVFGGRLIGNVNELERVDRVPSEYDVQMLRQLESEALLNRAVMATGATLALVFAVGGVWTW